MITAASVHPLIHEKQVRSPAVEWRPNVTTVMAQTAVGYVAGHFLLLVAHILYFPDRRNLLFVFFLLALPPLGVAAGLIVGLILWAGMEMAGDKLNTVFRSIIAAIMVGLGWLAFSVLLDRPLPPPTWGLSMILAPGIGIGLVTGSRLRLWHELVRKGDPVGPTLGVLAGLTGVLLRLTVAYWCMGWLVLLIAILQSPDPQEINVFWWIFVFGHFAAGSVLVFARVKTDVLLPLAVSANAPMVAVLLKFPWSQYVVIGYLALWAVFLLTRWRQTQVALSVLNEEFRYYLID